ncbi:MAG: tetratricopeptide repeat protein [Prevotella sp.]|nr:tetratricopeptide repeat protein [Prevotella sp.]MBP5507571.1 tetratricopeptide repeat protein [Prevotella sp.]
MDRRSVFLFLALLPLTVSAQFNVDRLIMSGRSALFYEDYVLAIQHFNRAIQSKPYLYEPWYYRGIAKYYLDDFAGAEGDCTEAINLNPYVTSIYELRGLCRIREKKYEEAIADYDRALRDEPSAQNFWFNRMLCRIELKDYDRAQLELDTIIHKWDKYARAYSVKAGICLLQNDTTAAAGWLDKALEIDPYDWESWLTRANISLSRQKWKEADKQLGQVIHLKPKMVGCYVNRALARLNTNNLRGAMADYDMAIEIDPDNFLAHYNRGILRVQVGDDNRAIEDFDFIVRMEPNNIMSVFNRALLLHKTGDLRGAIRDYTTIINQYPNFWEGLYRRAECYRRLGMTGQAEMDEFRILKAQMDKRIGVQPRWSKSQIKQTRKRSEIDFDKYNHVVVEDEEPKAIEHEYESVYRGKVQNRKVDLDYMPMYHLSYMRYANVVKAYQVFDKAVDAFNQRQQPRYTLYLTCNPSALNEQQSSVVFAYADTLAAQIQDEPDVQKTKYLLLQRAVAHTVVQNYGDAIDDLTTALGIDPNFALAYWQRGVCAAVVNEFNTTQGVEAKIKEANALYDLNKALELIPDDPYIHYDRGNLYFSQGDYAKAIEDYDAAINGNHLPEAYYNRGLAHIHNGNLQQGIADLSKAGELGIYSAYGMIKKYSK